MMSFKKITQALVTGLLFLSFFVTIAYADSAPLEVTSDGEVTVNSKLNINSALHLPPQSSPPASPEDGDIYYSSDRKLLIYGNLGWNIIFELPEQHGTKHLTSGSGTWTVPNGVTSIEVSLVGGGGGGGGGLYDYGAESDETFLTGGNGGHGGVRVKNQINVIPGQTFSYSVGSGGGGGAGGSAGAGGSGGTTVFGSLTTSGGGGGQGGTWWGTPYTGSAGSPQQGVYPGGSSYGNAGGGGYGKGNGGAGTSGAIYIEY